MKKYTRSVIILFIFTLILAPSTVYAEEELNMPVFSIAKALTGAAFSSDNLTDNINDWLSQYMTDGELDPEKYSEAASSGMVTEANFFENTVFVGDSLTVGLEKYCNSHDSVASDSTYFLARVSCSAKAAISSNALTKHAGIMPLYNGKVQYIEDSIAQLPDVKRMFICYGMNDLTGSTPQEFVSDLETLIGRITSKTPELEVHVISIPCVVSGVNKGYLSNKNIRHTNGLLEELCKENGWGFVNITEFLMGNDQSLRPEYSSDNYVHENNRAYTVWNNVLKDYAYMRTSK